MHTRVRFLRMMLLIISMMACVISPMHGQNRGQVTATAEPNMICPGESSHLHAEAVVETIIDFETGDFSQLSQYSFTNDPTYPWIVVDADNGSSKCIQSSNGGHHSTVSTFSISKSFASSGMISFDANCMGEGTSTAWDKCIFQIGNQTMFSYGATTTGWTDHSFYVEPGEYTFTWTYTKDSSVNPTGDYFRVDNIAFREIDGLHLYGFENGMQGWTTIDADGHGDAWSRVSYGAHEGSYCMRASYNYSYSHNDFLVSPRIKFGGKLVFYARRYGTGTGYDDYFRVYLSTSGNTSASYFTTELTNGNVAAPSTYTRYEYDLSAYQGEGYVAIVYTAPANQWYLYVDDITIIEDSSSPGGGGSSGDVTFQWEPGGMHGADITVTPTETTTYTVTAYQDNTPVGSAEQTIVVYQDPLLSISTNTGSAEICEGDTIVLYVTVGGGTDVKVGDIVCTDGSLVKPSDWPCDKTAKGIVFYVDATGQHGWAVDLGEITQTIKWSTLNQDISGLQNQTIWMNAILDLDGNANTQTIMSAGDNTKYPAAWAAHENGGYLPSVGQLNILFGEYFAVNTSLELVGGVQITSQNNAYLWSSTPNANNKVWIVTVDKGYFQAEMKSSNKSVRAIFDF